MIIECDACKVRNFLLVPFCTLSPLVSLHCSQHKDLWNTVIFWFVIFQELEAALRIFNYFFTAVFIIESGCKVVALGVRRYIRDRWNQLDVAIVILSIVGIVLEEMKSDLIPINPTIIRVMRVLRIARGKQKLWLFSIFESWVCFHWCICFAVLKLLKMAKGIRSLLDTVMQALPQVGNLGLLFYLLFFIFAALGVELFGRLGKYKHLRWSIKH